MGVSVMVILPYVIIVGLGMGGTDLIFRSEVSRSRTVVFRPDVYHKTLNYEHNAMIRLAFGMSQEEVIF
jgi:hypothetical protein